MQKGGGLSNVDHGLTATHLYGTGGLIAGFLGLLVSYKGTDGIYGWLLLASGWIVSAFMTWYLIKISSRLTGIIEKHDEATASYATRVTSLEATVEQQKNLIDQRLATLDYLSSQLLNRQATPRQPSQPTQGANEE